MWMCSKNWLKQKREFLISMVFRLVTEKCYMERFCFACTMLCYNPSEKGHNLIHNKRFNIIIFDKIVMSHWNAINTGSAVSSYGGSQCWTRMIWWGVHHNNIIVQCRMTPIMIISIPALAFQGPTQPSLVMQDLWGGRGEGGGDFKPWVISHPQDGMDRQEL